MSEAPKKYRAFTGIIYPDSVSYDCSEVLDSLGVIFEKWGYILHNCDSTETGEVKKAHYHWIGYRKAPVTLKTVANNLRVPENSVEFSKRGWVPCAQYLIHVNDANKYQYSVDDVVCNFDYNAVLVTELSKEDKARGIMAYIGKQRFVTIEEVGQWSLENGYWSEFIRAYPFWLKMVVDRETKM